MNTMTAPRRAIVGTVVAGALTASLTGAVLAANPDDAARAQWRQSLGWPNWCEEGYRAAAGGITPEGGVDLRTLPDGRMLLVVGCGVGAYQGTFLLYDVQIPQSAPATGRLLRVPTYDPTGARSVALKRVARSQVAGLITHSGDNTLLTVLTKFRGLGDCGVWVRYRMAPGGPVPLVVRAKVRCDGKPPYNPSRWPRYPVSGGRPTGA